MPPEPLPWDRKDFFKERKHERSESLGSIARWRDSSSHHGSREFPRWGSVDFRRPPGHGKQDGWQMFHEDSVHGYVSSRLADKMLEDESCRPPATRGDGKYGRNSRENRGSFGPKDSKGDSWETSDGSPSVARRLHDVNNDQRSVDDMLMYPSHPHSDFVNSWDQLHLKDQPDKMVGVNGLGTGQKCERENLLGSTDWRPLKWTRSGSMSSRGSGLSHSSSSKSMGGVDSNEMKAELLPKCTTPLQSPSGDAAGCATSAVPSEEMSSRKKPRLGWGEGLAKYEKKKIEGPEMSANKDGAVVSATNAESTQSLSSNLVDKSSRVTVFSDCASPATPSSVACSSSPGMEEKSFGKTASIDNDVSNLCRSPSLVPQNQCDRSSFNLEKLDITAIASLGSSIAELLQHDDSTLVDSSFVRSTAINKVLLWKFDFLKALEVTESEIDLLENELRLLKSECVQLYPCPAASSSLPRDGSTSPCKDQEAITNLIPRPAPLQIDSSGNAGEEKMPLCNGVLGEVQSDVKEEDVDSPGTATSKFNEPVGLTKSISPIDIVNSGECCSGILDQSTDMEMKCLGTASDVEKNCLSAGDNACMLIKCQKAASDSRNEISLVDRESRLFEMILASNKESAYRASEIFSKILPRAHCSSDISNVLFHLNDVSMKEKFAARKRLLRFKERALTLKFKAFQHLWKEDMRLLSIRKYRAKSQKKIELTSRTSHCGFQKHRSSIRSRFSSPVGNLSLVPTSEIVGYTNKLLSDSQVKLYRHDLKMPALILDDKEKLMSRFVSYNGLVEDPCAVERERAMINPWMPEEREIFMDKLAIFGKDFSKIATFLDQKTTADCVEFYYKNHKSECFQKAKKEFCLSKQGKFTANTYLVTSGKKWNREMNAASLDILGAATVMAAHADNVMGNRGRLLSGGRMDYKISHSEDAMVERSNSLDILRSERETAAADVLAGICGSLSSEAMSSCITSSIDPGEGYRELRCQKVGSSIKRSSFSDVTQTVDDDSCSDESCGEMDPTDWTDEEKSLFIQAVSSYGKDFAMISRCVRTRSRDQCKVFFSKARKCLGLDQIHPGSAAVGTPMSNDANGGGGDTEDACLLETSSVICSDKLAMDENLPMCAVSGNQDIFDPSWTLNMRTDLSRSEEANANKNSEVGHTLVSDVHLTKPTLGLAVEVNCNIKNGFDDEQLESVQTRKGADGLPDPECGRDHLSGLVASSEVTLAAWEAIDTCPPCTDAVVETRAVPEVCSEGLGIDDVGQGLLLHGSNCNDNRDEEHVMDTSDGSDLMQDSYAFGKAPSLAVDKSSCFGLSSNSENLNQVSLKLDSAEKPHVIPLPQENSLAIVNYSMPQDSSSIHGEKLVKQDRLSICKDEDFYQQSSGHVESSRILKGYPLHITMKKEVNGDTSCRQLSEGQCTSNVDMDISGPYVAQDCFLQKCNSSKHISTVSELPLLSQNIEQPVDQLRTHSRTLSDTEKPCRNGDVKLFGQILSNPSNTLKSNLSSHEAEKGTSHHSKQISKSSNFIFSGHRSTDGNIAVMKFDQNNYVGLENVPLRSYGYWDGSKIQTCYPPATGSDLLLTKYPAAFRKYPALSSKMEQQPLPLQAVVKGNECSLNSVSVFSPKEISSSNGVVDFQVHRSRDGTTKVQPFSVEVKQQPFSEMQRRNGLEASSIQQQQSRGMVGVNVNVVGRGGILVGPPCTDISDPVAALKMHYAKAEQYGGQGGSGGGGTVVREEESWRGKGDIGSR